MDKLEGKTNNKNVFKKMREEEERAIVVENEKKIIAEVKKEKAKEMKAKAGRKAETLGEVDVPVDEEGLKTAPKNPEMDKERASDNQIFKKLSDWGVKAASPIKRRCEETGHFARDCVQRKQWGGERTGEQEKQRPEEREGEEGKEDEEEKVRMCLKGRRRRKRDNGGEWRR
ncbi:hypothetical protein KUCAC02_019337 [Chaenocephalus aceratus]|nr:hypothetical protein KUCAC02_019337 [Chaenocephalus aceratus]